MKLPNEKQLKQYEDMGVNPPSHDAHGSDTWAHPISEQMTKARCWNWRLEGNILKCDTDFGPLSQTIPTGYICKGEKDGLPILEKIVA